MTRAHDRTAGVDEPVAVRARRLGLDRVMGTRLVVAGLVAILVLVPFSLLALLVLDRWPPLARLDQSVTDTLHSYAVSHPEWVEFMNGWTNVFGPMPLRIGVLLLAIWLWRRGGRRMTIWVAATMAVGGLLGALLKLLVGRHRPDLLEPVARAAGFSFPSGHALNATLAAGVLLLVLLPLTRGRWLARVALVVVAVVVAGLTGLSRVALGVHWTSDVVGGWLLGTAVVTFMAAASPWREPMVKRQARAVIAEDGSPEDGNA